MATGLTGISDQQMAAYQATARKRAAEKERQMEEHRQHAWAVAQQAATLLKVHYKATRVILFGSLARGGFFHTRSDIDLAAENMSETNYDRAVTQLLNLDSAFEIDLVRLEEAPTYLRRTIEEEGIAL
jgi:predicted nucleotidyltransferase